MVGRGSGFAAGSVQRMVTGPNFYPELFWYLYISAWLSGAEENRMGVPGFDSIDL